MDVERGRTPAAAVAGIVLVVLGALLLLDQLGVDLFSFGWPFVVIAAGLLCFAAMVARGRRGAPLAIPGSIVTVVGLILLFQNTFDHWETWAYVWALIFPTALGIGLIVQGAWAGDPSTTRTGMRFVVTGLIVFVALAAFFEVVLNLSGFAGVTGVVYILAAALIVAGLVAIGSGMRARRETGPGA
ncbi:MAG TPA: hypothetical protein VFN57_10550 [Thermomicrobiaceae bacterium]|nr:hypothetical protein [Thermomicrobiaceae bacterium]